MLRGPEGCVKRRVASDGNRFEGHCGSHSNVISNTLLNIHLVI
jgi:hypothetical protein